MNLQVDIESACSETVPEEEDLRYWIAAAVAGQTSQEQIEISVRLVSCEEMSLLNQTYRGKAGPTNVLAFPASLPAELALSLLGDIVICAPVVQAEATAQGKELTAHWAHMAVHGTLHLLGYDHIDEEEAAIMEALETTILGGLNFDCPYEGILSQEYSR
jgi:probable rRNA maturation factor